MDMEADRRCAVLLLADAARILDLMWQDAVLEHSDEVLDLTEASMDVHRALIRLVPGASDIVTDEPLGTEAFVG